MSGGAALFVVFAAFAALALGLAVGWLWAAARERARGEARPRELEAQLREVEPKLREAEGAARAAHATAEELRRSLGVAEDRAHRLEQELGESQKARAVAETQAVELRRNLDEQKALLDSAEEKLGDTFRALAAQALAANNEGFLTLAAEKLTAARKETDDTLAARQTAIDGLLKPVKESLDKVDTKIQELERERGQAYGRLTELVRNLSEIAQQACRRKPATWCGPCARRPCAGAGARSSLYAWSSWPAWSSTAISSSKKPWRATTAACGLI